MDILYLMIICSVSLATVFLIVFIISAKRGQFDEGEGPAIRMLLDKDDSTIESEFKKKDKTD